MSTPHTSRFIEPFLRWLVPGISQAVLEQVHFLIRKTGHLTEYAVLAVLLRFSLKNTTAEFCDRAYWKTLGTALLLAATYAATDELHQAFVPSRIGSVVDVLIDTCGAAMGLGMVVAWGGAAQWGRRRATPAG